MDDDLGLVNMQGRMCDPRLGRFLSPDPIVQAPLNAQSYNRYAYVFNNPLRFTDPSGFTAGVDGAPFDMDGPSLDEVCLNKGQFAFQGQCIDSGELCSSHPEAAACETSVTIDEDARDWDHRRSSTADQLSSHGLGPGSGGGSCGAPTSPPPVAANTDGGGQENPGGGVDAPPAPPPCHGGHHRRLLSTTTMTRFAMGTIGARAVVLEDVA